MTMDGSGVEHPRADSDADGLGLRRWRRLALWLYALMVVSAVVGVLAAFTFGHPRAGHHRSIAGLVAAVAISVALVTVTMAVTWMVMRRHGPTRRLMRADWKTRRRVAVALRKGRPIAPADRATAHALIDVVRSRRWLPWFYFAGAAVELLGFAISHGVTRWFELAAGIAFLALAPYWLWMRRTLVSREADLPSVAEEAAIASRGSS